MFDDARAAWKPRPPRALTRVSPGTRTEFMSHWNGGPTALTAADPHSACLAVIKADQDFHMDGRGWADIGYNGAVCPHGRAIECRGIDYAGAHCTGHNTSAYGWQFMIGKGETATPAMFARMARALADCEARSGHALRRMGHRDGLATECPGDQIEAWVKAGMLTTTQEEDMAVTEDDARTLLTGSAVMKNVFAKDPDAAPRVAASYLIEQTAMRVAKLSGPAPVSVDLEALAAKVADLLAKRLAS